MNIAVLDDHRRVNSMINMQHIEVSDLCNYIKEVRPVRFNNSNRSLSFNDPRVTDFAYVNLYVLYRISLVLKQTKVKSVQTIVNYDSRTVIIISPGFTFRYEIPFIEEK